MSLIRRVARPMIAASVIAGGLDQLRHPAKSASAVAPLADRAAPALHLPNDPELLVRANGVVQVVGGAMLATGRMPRTSALVLAVSMVPSTYVSHPFWAEKDATARAQERRGFMKSLAVIGALLLAAVDTEGRPGVAYRMHLATDRAERAAKTTRREARYATTAAKREARLRVRQAHDALT
jgi:putative oxidoreductase